MDTIFYQELAKHSEEIAIGKDVVDSEREELINVSGILVGFSYMVRREGFLALEDAVGELPDDGIYSCLREMCMHMVDGMDPEILKELAYMYYFSRRMVSYNALSYLVCLSVVLSIQAGEHPGIIEMKILSMVPEGDIHDCQDAMEKVKPKKLTLDEKMEMLFEGDLSVKPDNPDYDMIKAADDLLAGMNEGIAEYFLRNIENTTIAVSMKVLSGAARKVILTSVSRNLAGMLIEDMEFMGPVRMKDVSEAIREMLQIYIKLLEEDFIFNEDPDIGEKFRAFLPEKQG